jgi:flagellar biosynthesis/type III secretory pathway chaperone
LEKRLNHQNTYADLCEDDKNFMQIKVQEKGSEMHQLLEKLKDENTKNKDLISQVKSQEIEIKTLLNCVENLRK